MSEAIVTRRDGEIAEIALNRPEACNALNLEMMTQLVDQLTLLATDTSIKGIVLVGRGKAFCAGGDLKWARNHEFGEKEIGSGSYPLHFANVAKKVIEARTKI